MKRIFYLLTFLTLLSFASKVSAQGVAYHDISFYNSSGNVRVISSALITVCASGWTSPPPCAPALGNTLFSNFALTSAISNPFNADANGNFNFIALPGNYTVCITGVGVSGVCNQVTLSNGSSSITLCSGTITLTTGSIAGNGVARNTFSCPSIVTGINPLGGVDTINCAFVGDTNGVTGYTPGGGIALKVWISAGTVNVDQQNTTGSPITPGAASINCKGLR